METDLGPTSEFAPESFKSLTADGTDIIVFRHLDGSFSALEDRCSHADVPLSEGSFENGVIECCAHGAKFDSRTGKQLCLPAVSPVQVFRVYEREGRVIVEL